MYFRLYKCNYCNYVFAHWYVAEKVTKIAGIWMVKWPYKECELCSLQSEEVNVLRWDNFVDATLALGYFNLSAVV